MPAPHEMSSKHLSRLIGTPHCPAIVDLCTDEDFAADPYLIPGAVRASHTDMPALLRTVQNTPVVLYCQKGRKLSQGAASWLRGQGVAAEYLEGGMQGWARAPENQRIPYAALPTGVDGSTLWVTRHRPRIDRIACPWLITRFVDRAARFLFVSPAEVLPVADRFGAVSYDAPGAAFGHVGDACTFDALLDHFRLRSAALDLMAKVIRAADTNRHDLHPAAAGLLAVSVGLSRQYRDDHEQMRAGLAIYDALYRWARDGSGEQHASHAAQGAA